MLKIFSFATAPNTNLKHIQWHIKLFKIGLFALIFPLVFIFALNVSESYFERSIERKSNILMCFDYEIDHQKENFEKFIETIANKLNSEDSIDNENIKPITFFGISIDDFNAQIQAPTGGNANTNEFGLRIKISNRIYTELANFIISVSLTLFSTYFFQLILLPLFLFYLAYRILKLLFKNSKS